MPGNDRTLTEREQRLQDVVLEYLQAVDAGQAPTPEEVVRRHPDLAAELMAFFADQHGLSTVLSPLRQLAVATAPLPTRLGEYRILRPVGRGGMGVVYEAVQEPLGRRVALKVLPVLSRSDPTLRERFRREAQATARLHHPNIVQIFEVGEHDGQPFLALEFIDGPSLAERLREGPQPPRQAAALLETLARAMHHAHQQGVVHRDLKPANVLLAPPAGGAVVGWWGGEQAHHPTTSPPHDLANPKITDFGLAHPGD